MNEKKQLSIFISLVLRHKPEAAGITVDEHGWAKVEELITGINNTGRKIDYEILEEIVKTDNKQRYSFNSDKTLIRANQGHSIHVNVDLKEASPPDILYHGTAIKNKSSILTYGIKPMSRLYVHLSKDKNTANKVGKRHGKPCVICINSKKMKEDGIPCYLSENGVWLTKYVDVKYIIRMED